jgi:hypothetical protein
LDLSAAGQRDKGKACMRAFELMGDAKAAIIAAARERDALAEQLRQAVTRDDVLKPECADKLTRMGLCKVWEYNEAKADGEVMRQKIMQWASADMRVSSREAETYLGRAVSILMADIRDAAAQPHPGTALADENRRLREVLRECEWVYDGECLGKLCPCCGGGDEDGGHLPDCKLAAALAGKEVGK